MIKVYDVVPIDQLKSDTVYSLVLVNKNSGKPYSVWNSNNLAFPETDDATVVVAVNAPKKEIETQLNNIFFKNGAFYRTWERYPTRLTVYENQDTQLYLKAPERKEAKVTININKTKELETKTDATGELKYVIKYSEFKDCPDFFKIRVYNDEWGRATIQAMIRHLEEFDYSYMKGQSDETLTKLQEEIGRLIENPQSIDQTASMIKNLLSGLTSVGTDNSINNIFNVAGQLNKDVDSNELLQHINVKVPDLGKMLGEDKELIDEIQKLAKEQGVESLNYDSLIKILYKLKGKK